MTATESDSGTTTAGTLRLQALLPHAALFLSVTILGSSFVAARAIMEHHDGPATVGFLRYAIAALCLLPFVLVRRRRLRRGEVVFAMGLGLLQFGLFHLFVNTALQQIPAARGAVIFALIPVMTMLIAAVAGRDRLSWLMTLAAVISFSGVALAVGEKALDPGVGGAGLIGEGLFFLAVCCGATYNAFSARLYKTGSIFFISMLAMVGGSLLLLPFAAAEGLFVKGPGFSSEDWLWFLWLAIPGGAIGMLLFNWGLRRLSPTRAAIYVPISPIAATAFGAALLGEEITPLFLIGLACAVAGPMLVNFRHAARR